MIFRSLVRIFEFLAILLIVRLVLRALVGFFATPASPSAQAASPRRSIEAVDMVKDRVCDTFVPRQSALVARLGGGEEYFCSPACRDKALAALRQAS